MSSCELPLPGPVLAALTAKGSRVQRFRPAGGAGPHTWQGVAVQEYKQAAENHCGVIRSVLAGDGYDKTSFQIRYFEIGPGGFTTLERHRHEHVVIVLRGTGRVRLGDTWHEVGFGDTVYVAPDEVHQLRNDGGEPFGFLCVVDRERDRPVPASE